MLSESEYISKMRGLVRVIDSSSPAAEAGVVLLSRRTLIPAASCMMVTRQWMRFSSIG